MEADFSGYATKAGIKCSDGRTITSDAFKHQDKMKVPLVWQHGHNEPNNVLGHAILEARPDGVYAYGFFNDTEAGRSAKTLVEHGDITALSIYANQLVEKAKSVLHGAIREVSLVLSGANPGALIDNVRIAHSSDPNDIETLDDEAVIYTGLTLEHASDTAEAVEESTEETVVEHADGDEKTVQDVYDSFTDEQKEVVHFMIGAALEQADEDEDGEGDSVAQSSTSEDTDETAVEHNDTDDEGDLTHQEGTNDMSRNVFDQNGTKADDGPTLSHAQLQTIVETAKKPGETFKSAFLAHAQEYGITDIDFLFPDAKNVTSQPELISRRTEWVRGVIDGAKHSPFSRIKSLAADLTADEARAKGYVKGNLKKDEVVKLLKRVTGPTTIYKKQKLDRDDIIDITDLDVVAWLKWEMRFMLEEELARAILIGDGREPDDEDKINEDHIRPIAWDHEMYSHPVTVPSNTTPEGIVESVLRARKHYKGSGQPTFYTTEDILTDMLLVKDRMGRRMYDTEADVAAALRCRNIVTVEVMEDVPDLLGIIVNIADYTIGADKGGAMSMFDDFDIDYNQYKYLIETRASGALTKPKSAVVIKRTTGTVVVASAPTFDPATNALTVPTVAGVSYFDVTTTDDVELTDGETYYITRTTDVEARADAGYSFAHNTDNDWTFAYNADAPAAPVGEPTLPA